METANLCILTSFIVFLLMFHYFRHIYSLIVFIWLMCFCCIIEEFSSCLVHILLFYIFIHIVLFFLEWANGGCIVAYFPLGPAGRLLFYDAG